MASAEPPPGRGLVLPGRRWPPICPTDSPVLAEEIFGPLLAVERVRDVEHACDVVDGLPSPSPAACSPAIPRPSARSAPAPPSATCTSTAGSPARWSVRQPFGGNRLSGTGLKAGGPDYLLQFVEQRAVSENTMRHGLVV